MDDVRAPGEAQQREPGAGVVGVRAAVRPDRVQVHVGAPFQPLPGERSARAGDIDREAAGRQRLDKGHHVTGDAAVAGLGRDEEALV